MFGLASNLNALVLDLVSWTGGQAVWDIIFRRNLLDYELETCCSMLQIIYKVKLDRGDRDT